MANFQLLGSDEHTYSIDPGNGEPLTVAKSALDPALVQQIEALQSKQAAPAPDAVGPQIAANSTGMQDIGAPIGMPPSPQAQPFMMPPGGFLTPNIHSPMDQPSMPGSQMAPPAPSPQAPPSPQDKGAMGPSQPEEAGHIDTKIIAPPYTPGAQNTPPLTGRMGAIDQGYQMQTQGIKESANAGAQQAAATAGYLDQAAKEAERRRLENEKRVQTQESEVKAQMDKVKTLTDDLQKDGEIKPDRYWNNMSTGNKILAGISIALGGLGGALTGHGGNAAMDVINGAIQRDFEAQKLELQKKQSNLTNQAGILGQMRANFSDARQADSAALAAMYQNAGLQVQKIAAQYQSPEMQARAKQLMGDLQTKYNEQMAGFEMSIRQQQALMGASGAQGPGQGITNPLMLPKENQDKAVKMPNGYYGLTTSAEAAKEVNKTSAAAMEMRSTIKEMRALQAKAGRELPWTDAAKESAALQSRLMFQNQQLEGIQRLSDADIHLLEKQMSSPTGFRQDATTNLMNQMDRHIGSKLDSLYRQHIVGYQGKTDGIAVGAPVK